MKLNCMIIDDEPLAISVIKKHIDTVKGLETTAWFVNPLDAVETFQNQTIDVLFLDIDMPLINGLDFLRTLKKPPLVVITTAYREYAVESFELDVLDYLVKPISLERFVKTTHKIFKHFNLRNQSANTYFFVKIKNKKLKIHYDEILFVEGLKDYVKIKTLSKNYIVHRTLGSIIEQFPCDQFVRIHKSYVISLDKLEAVEGNRIEISGMWLPIGKTYASRVKDKIFNR